jgi:serine/threonine protein kinase
MATVYLAQDLKHDRQVAIKVLRPELAAVIGAERFLREIKTTFERQSLYPRCRLESPQLPAESAATEVSMFTGRSVRRRLEWS